MEFFKLKFLVNDINKLLKSQNKQTLQLIGQSPKKQLEEVGAKVSLT